jgi:hypothetical protein
MVVVTRKGLVLSDEVQELYERCWKTVRETLSKLKIDAAFLDGIRNPYELVKIFEVVDDPQKSKRLEGWQKELLYAVDKTLAKLNEEFAERNGLPKTLTSNEDLLTLSKYIEKNFGRKLNLSLSEGAICCNTDGLSNIVFKKGMNTIDAVNSVFHEESHLSEKFAVKLKKAVESTLWHPRGDGSIGVASFYSKITNADENEIWKRHQLQKRNYSFYDPAVFLIQLYNDGVYKPADDEMRENLEFSKFYLNREMRRAYRRYMEGRAYCAELGTLESSDETLRAEGALEILLRIPCQGADFFAGYSGYRVRSARDDEGFRYYYTVQQRVGKENLEKFERFCAEREFVPGINREGNLVAIDPKRMEMHGVKIERLKAGVIDLGEREAVAEPKPELPKIMD